MKMFVVGVFALMTLSIGCKKDAAAPAGPPPTGTPAAETPAAGTPAAAEHGEQGAKPGSHEDWCGAHGVPESQCTRCNAELIPAFKATNDWCGEHGLPESQCLKCDPTRKKERPPKVAAP